MRESINKLSQTDQVRPVIAVWFEFSICNVKCSRIELFTKLKNVKLLKIRFFEVF